MTNIEFIDTIANYIRPIAKEKGYPFISAIVAQACLESNFGRSTLSARYNNFFGMKCGTSWKGKSVNMRTHEEYVKGTMTNIKDNFRVYDSIEEGIKGYFSFISTRRYSNLKNATSPYEYIDLLKADGWATDSAYVSKLNSIYETFHLYELDTEKEKPYQIPTYRMKREEVKTVIFRYIFGYYNTQRINSFNEGGLPPVALRTSTGLAHHAA